MSEFLSLFGNRRRIRAFEPRWGRLIWTPEVLPSPKPLSTVGHLAMGMALGVVFALVLLFIANHSVLMLISDSPSPALGLTLFIGVLALTFGLGATLTGLVLEDADEQ